MLDVNGGGEATLDLSSIAPLPSSLLGLNLHFAPVALNVNLGRLVTGAPLYVEIR